jgi:PD-(D/E)XK nuclease superfamily
MSVPARAGGVPYPNALERFPTLRQSLLSQFDNCGLTAWFELEYGKGWSTHAQARGKIMHSVIAECIRQMAANHANEIPTDAALTILRDMLRQDDADRACRRCGSPNLEPGVSPTGMRTCADCGAEFESQLVNLPLREVKDMFWTTIKWATDNSWAIEDVVDVELRLETEIRYPNRLPGIVDPWVVRLLTGQLDLLLVEGTEAEHAIVLDHKDTWGMPGPQELDKETGYFQQRFYGLLIFRNFPSVERVTLREHYIRYSETREASLTREDEPEIESELAALVERFDRQFEEQLSLPKDSPRAVFRPTPGKWCSWCIRPNACPILPFARGDGRITDEARAVEVAGQLTVAEEIVKGTRQALRAWSSTHGPIPVAAAKGSRALGYTESERVARPSKEEVVRAVRENGGCESVDLDKLWRKTRGTRFGPFDPSRQPAEDDPDLQRKLEESIEAARRARIGR